MKFHAGGQQSLEIIFGCIIKSYFVTHGTYKVPFSHTNKISVDE